MSGLEDGIVDALRDVAAAATGACELCPTVMDGHLAGVRTPASPMHAGSGTQGEGRDVAWPI
jgi:hypothetical protein